jgi:hypothetical protein
MNVDQSGRNCLARRPGDDWLASRKSPIEFNQPCGSGRRAGLRRREQRAPTSADCPATQRAMLPCRTHRTVLVPGTIACHWRSKFQRFNSPGRIRRDLPYSAQKLIAAAGPAGCGNATMMSMHARQLMALKTLAWPLIARTGCMPPERGPPYKITFLLWATIERTNAILTCLASRCTVWAKSGGDAQVDPDRVPQSLD